MEFRRVVKQPLDDYQGPTHISPLRLGTPRYSNAFCSNPRQRLPWQFSNKNTKDSKILNKPWLIPKRNKEQRSFESHSGSLRIRQNSYGSRSGLTYNSISQQWQQSTASNHDLIRELNMSSTHRLNERKASDDSLSPEASRLLPVLRNSSLGDCSTRDATVDEKLRLISPSARIYSRRLRGIRAGQKLEEGWR